MILKLIYQWNVFQRKCYTEQKRARAAVIYKGMWKPGSHAFSFLHTPFHWSPQTSKVGSQGSRAHTFLKKSSFWIIIGITKNDGKQVPISNSSILIIKKKKKDPSFHSDTFRGSWWFQNNYIFQDFRISMYFFHNENWQIFWRRWNYFSTLPAPQLLHAGTCLLSKKIKRKQMHFGNQVDFLFP